MSRPEKTVDWDKVDELLRANCHGTEIAVHFDMHHDTFYRKVEEKYKISFTAYSQQKKGEGDSLLKYAQYKKAVKGDNTMLVWLGKNRLGQKEKEDEKMYNERSEQYLDMFFKWMQDQQSQSLTRSDLRTDNISEPKA